MRTTASVDKNISSPSANQCPRSSSSTTFHGGACGAVTQPGSGRATARHAWKGYPTLSSCGAHGQSERFEALCFREGSTTIWRPWVSEVPLGASCVRAGPELGQARHCPWSCSKGCAGNMGTLLAPVKRLPQILNQIKECGGWVGVKKQRQMQNMQVVGDGPEHLSVLGTRRCETHRHHC